MNCASTAGRAEKDMLHRRSEGCSWGKETPGVQSADQTPGERRGDGSSSGRGWRGQGVKLGICT